MRIGAIAGMGLKLLAATGLGLIAATPIQADMNGNRPTVSKASDCQGWWCEGALCSCCYADGCWICDNIAGQDLPGLCVWEQGLIMSRPAPGMIGWVAELPRFTPVPFRPLVVPREPPLGIFVPFQ